MKHTPGTLYRDGFNLSAIIRLVFPIGHPECKHTSGTYETLFRCEGENWDANAKRLVKVWNSHDELLEALKMWRNAYTAEVSDSQKAKLRLAADAFSRNAIRNAEREVL